MRKEASTWKSQAATSVRWLIQKLSDIQVGGQTRVDLATLAFSPCFTGFFGPVSGVNLIKTL